MLGALAGSIISGIYGQNEADKRQDKAHLFSAQQFASRYQTTVKDMQAAGLNPMLAYSQGGGNSPSGNAGATPSVPDLGSVYNSSRLASAQVANIQADTANKNAQADLIAGQAAQAWSSADVNEWSVKHTQYMLGKIFQETENLRSDKERIIATVKMLDSEAEMMRQRGLSEVQLREQMRSLISKINADTRLVTLDVDAAESLGNIGREMGQLRWIIDIIRALGRH